MNGKLEKPLALLSGYESFIPDAMKLLLDHVCLPSFFNKFLNCQEVGVFCFPTLGIMQH
jgi:hypothetical protein